MKLLILFFIYILSSDSFSSSAARLAGFPFEGKPGLKNALLDISGIEVGMTTVIEGGVDKKPIGSGPARTGVTVIFPTGKRGALTQVFAGWHAANGAGELTGSTWIEESGFLNGPIAITNTNSVGVVRDAIIKWYVLHNQPSENITLPVVGETFDGFLSDIFAFHLKEQHVLDALNGAHAKALPEGNVGGGTGMICFEFKCGTGTSSRIVEINKKGYTVAALVQANFGLRHQLVLGGTKVGKVLKDNLVWNQEKGSIIGIIATNAPLLPHQLKRIARRGTHGIARLGATSGDGSGDIFLAFSTVNAQLPDSSGARSVEFLANEDLDRIFEATAQSVEEAVVNSMVQAKEMVGRDGHRVIRLPVENAIKLIPKS